MWKIKLAAVIFYISLHHAYQYKIADVGISEPNYDFDILMFSQEYPVTVCKFWLSDLNGTDCNLPDEKNRWTVHGIWPWKYGDKCNFCNSSWVFDPEEIKSIESELQQAWIPVYNEDDQYTFWRHEWMKHGTCGTGLEPLNSVFKYFNKGIEWNEKYSLSRMLAAANIFPDDNKELNPEEIVNAVKAATKKSARMGCYLVNGVMYAQELRICFDKQFNLIDCRPPAVDEFCRTAKAVVLPANV